MRMMLDVGIGATQPWMLRKIPEQRRIGNALPSLVQPDACYVCVDQDPDLLKICADGLSKDKRVEGRVKCVLANGGELPFRSEAFDAVFLSDVFSAPEDDFCACDADCECGCEQCDCLSDHYSDEEGGGSEDHEVLCCGKLHRGLPQAGKQTILEEAFRVLRPDGILVAAIYQTPSYAFASFERIAEFIAQGTLALTEHAEEIWVNRFHGDYRGWSEWLLRKRKNGGPHTPASSNALTSQLLRRNRPNDPSGFGFSGWF